MRLQVKEDSCLDVLRQYERAYGQQVNFEKSGILFSPNLGVDLRELIMNKLSISQAFARERYLGLPLYVGEDKKKEFRALKEKIWGQYVAGLA